MPNAVVDDTYDSVTSNALNNSLANLCLRLPPDSRSHLFYVDVYINNFVTLVQGAPQSDDRSNDISLLQSTPPSF